MHPARLPHTFVLTAVAMAAFASNSILCRLALQSRAVDPATFTLIRILAGAVTLLLLVRTARKRSGGPGSALAPVFLFAYAIAFSFAYTSLGAGTGALILFGCVQATMIGAAIRAGERPRALEWIGLAIAVAGLVYLVAPGLSAPAPLGSALMAVAGVAWGLYSLSGRGSASPLADTGRNFVRAIPMAAAGALVARLAGGEVHVSSTGALLAATSGALSSGLGYAIWYAALRGLTATRAATVQLSVPVLTAVAGVAFLSERMSMRLVLAAALILGGIAVALLGRAAPAARPAR